MYWLILFLTLCVERPRRKPVFHEVHTVELCGKQPNGVNIDCRRPTYPTP